MISVSGLNMAAKVTILACARNWNSLIEFADFILASNFVLYSHGLYTGSQSMNIFIQIIVW